MAGIGFTLRRLTRKDNLIGVVHAYGAAMMAAAGPWLFTVIALAGITSFDVNQSSPLYLTPGGGFTSSPLGMKGLLNFRVIVIYNFAFSLVFSAPFFMIATRYLADHIHKKNVTTVPSVMLGTLTLLYASQFPIAGWFYLFYVDLALDLRLSALINLFLISTVWLLGVFLMALKAYNAVTVAYGLGMVISLVCARLLYPHYQDSGMLNGFSIGLAFIVFTLSARIFSEYAYRFTKPFDINPFFRSYWPLALAGLFYNAAIWVDKWIMWFAPEAEEWMRQVGLDNGMRMYPDYDSAMFLAYLTIVPAMAVFVFSVETNFFERYQRFYDNILQHKPLRRILANQQSVIDSITNSSRNFFIVQGVIAFLSIALAPRLFELLNINFTQIGIFRMGVLGAFFHVLLLFEIIILSYFDNRKMIMYLSLFYLIANAGLTYITLLKGFEYYGMGYFISSMLTFLIASFLLISYMRRLPFHAFITSNNSIRH